MREAVECLAADAPISGQPRERMTRVKAAKRRRRRAAFYEGCCCQALTIPRGSAHTSPTRSDKCPSTGARNGGQDRASGERSSRSLDHREHARTLLARSESDDTPTSVSWDPSARSGLMP